MNGTPTLEGLQEYHESGWERGPGTSDDVADTLRIDTLADAKPVAKLMIKAFANYRAFRKPNPERAERVG